MNGHGDYSKYEAQVWLWEHKGLLVVLGVLLVAALAAVGGNGF
jgi:hypothetical protein